MSDPIEDAIDLIEKVYAFRLDDGSLPFNTCDYHGMGKIAENARAEHASLMRVIEAVREWAKDDRPEDSGFNKVRNLQRAFDEYKATK